MKNISEAKSQFITNSRTMNSDGTLIRNTFNEFFANIGLILAKMIPDQRLSRHQLMSRGRARGPAGFDAPFNMGSTKCEIE